MFSKVSFEAEELQTPNKMKEKKMKISELCSDLKNLFTSFRNGNLKLFK